VTAAAFVSAAGSTRIALPTAHRPRRTAAGSLSISASHPWCWLRESRLVQLAWRSETFKFSIDSDLVAKVTDDIGLYLAPPANSIVLCIDEKSRAPQDACVSRAG